MTEQKYGHRYGEGGTVSLWVYTQTHQPDSNVQRLRDQAVRDAVGRDEDGSGFDVNGERDMSFPFTVNEAEELGKALVRLAGVPGVIRAAVL